MDSLIVCVGKNCREKASRELLKLLDGAYRRSESEHADQKLGITLCNKHCEHAPVAYCNGRVIGDINLADAEALVREFTSKNFDEIFCRFAFKEASLSD